MNKKGQIAIFVIIALVIVAVVIAAVMYPKLRGAISPGAFSPEPFLKSCVEPAVKDYVELLASRGGYEKIEGYANYRGMQAKYLCYTSNYFETCTVQQPLIKSNFEAELTRMLTPRIKTCYDNLRGEYQRRGYSVFQTGANFSVSIDIKGVNVDFPATTVTQGETTQRFDRFSITVQSQIYNLLMIATSIVSFEASFGDSETTVYLQFYPNIKIDKKLLDDGIKIYTISDVTTKESFIFASRSLVWPAGYGVKT